MQPLRFASRIPIILLVREYSPPQRRPAPLWITLGPSEGPTEREQVPCGGGTDAPTTTIIGGSFRERCKKCGHIFKWWIDVVGRQSGHKSALSDRCARDILCGLSPTVARILEILIRGRACPVASTHGGWWCNWESHLLRAATAHYLTLGYVNGSLIIL